MNFYHGSKFKGIVHSRKKLDCPLWVGGEILPQVQDFKYLCHVHELVKDGLSW